MDLKGLVLSEDQQQILDQAGNVVYVSTQNADGTEYFVKPENLTRALLCIDWDTVEVCVRWGEDHVCLQWVEKKVCVQWQQL